MRKKTSQGFLFRNSPFKRPDVICQRHPQKNEQGTKNKPQRYRLAKNEPSKDNSSDWIQIDIVGGYYGTKLLYDPIPRQEAHHRSHTPQEQQVPQHLRLCKQQMNVHRWIYYNSSFGSAMQPPLI